jgi:acetyltransferase-like isoleucine patch superfamily enzyme
VVVIDGGTPESRRLYERIQRSIAAAERLNATPFADTAAIRRAWEDLTGQAVDETFSLIPPIHCDHGPGITVGRHVFINQGCTFAGVGGITIGDEVLIGPNVSLVSAGHPLEPAKRRRQITADPIVIGRNVWLGAGATVLQGVTVGDDAVVAAGAVVTRDVPPATVVAGVPARHLKSVYDE